MPRHPARRPSQVSPRGSVLNATHHGRGGGSKNLPLSGTPLPKASSDLDQPLARYVSCQGAGERAKERRPLWGFLRLSRPAAPKGNASNVLALYSTVPPRTYRGGILVPPTRFERATRGLGNRCSIHLSYGGSVWSQNCEWCVM